MARFKTITRKKPRPDGTGPYRLMGIRIMGLCISGQTSG